MLQRTDLWLYPDGSTSGDLGASEHAEVALREMLKLPDDTTIRKDRLFGGITPAEAKAALKRGADKDAVDFLLKTRGDPRLYAVKNLGWIRVARNAINVWKFDDETVDLLRRSDLWKSHPQVEDYDMFLIDEMSAPQGQTFEVSAGKLRKRGASADALRYTAQGVGRYRNPVGGRTDEAFDVESNGRMIHFRPSSNNPPPGIHHAPYGVASGAQILMGLSVRGVPRFSPDAVREYVLTYRRRQLGLALRSGKLTSDEGHGGSVTPSLGFWEKITQEGHGKEESVAISLLDLSGEGMSFVGGKPQGMFYDHISDMVDHMAVEFQQKSIITQYHARGIVRAVQDTINDNV